MTDLILGKEAVNRAASCQTRFWVGADPETQEMSAPNIIIEWLETFSEIDFSNTVSKPGLEVQGRTTDGLFISDLESGQPSEKQREILEE